MASKWRLSSLCWNLHRVRGMRETLLLACLRCRNSFYRIHTKMLVTHGSLQNSSLDSDILGQLNLRPDAHQQDPRDRVPAKVRMTASQPVTELPIMHIQATHNNTIITLSDCEGKVIAWTSAGAVGFKGTRKGTNLAGQEAGAEAARKALKLGLKNFQVKLKGSGPGRKPSLKGLEMGGINVIAIQDVTPVPHNGCKPKKARRL